MTTPAMPNHSALREFFVRRTPRACHGACDHLRPGRLRASHAVCLRYSTLEPVICARKEGADIESLSTTKSIFGESLFMRGDFFEIWTVLFGFYTTSRHCISRLSPRNSNLNEVTANNGAAENCSGRQRASRLLLPAEPAAQQSRRTLPPSAVSELESLAVSSCLPEDKP